MLGTNTTQNRDSETNVKCTNIALPRNNLSSINTDSDTRYCESPKVDKYSDAKLSGALERLSPSEITVINTLVELSSSPHISHMSDTTQIQMDQTI